MAFSIFGDDIKAAIGVEGVYRCGEDFVITRPLQPYTLV
jgi:hypothetical protein